MDTIILVIGVVGFSISSWVLRGYFVNVSPLSSGQQPTLESESSQDESVADLPPMNYVSLEEQQQVLQRLEQLEKAGLVPNVVQNGSLTDSDSTAPISISEASRGEVGTELGSAETGINEDTLHSEKWKEIVALQEAYQRERQKEREIDYEREQTLFDISQSYDGRRPGQIDGSVSAGEKETEERLLDNQYEVGEDLEMYHERMNQFATLSKEVLIMRLESANAQIREQQERHQASLLNIIATLIEKMPGDVNLKNIAQSSFIAASTEIADEDSETNRENFQKMFYESFGR